MTDQMYPRNWVMLTSGTLRNQCYCTVLHCEPPARRGGAFSPALATSNLYRGALVPDRGEWPFSVTETPASSSLQSAIPLQLRVERVIPIALLLSHTISAGCVAEHE